MTISWLLSDGAVLMVDLNCRCGMQNLVDNLLAKWNSLPASEQPAHLGERLEELFLEASMLEAVRTAAPPPSWHHGWHHEKLKERGALDMQRTLPHGKSEDGIAYVQHKQGLMLTADCSLKVRNNQVPKPRAMVEDILARVTLLDAELGMHMGPVPPPSPTSSMGSPHATGSGSQVPYMRGLPKRGASSIALFRMHTCNMLERRL